MPLAIVLPTLFLVFAFSFRADAGDGSHLDSSPYRSGPTSKELVLALFELQFSFDASAASGAAGNAGSEFDGTYYYTTRWASNLIHKYDKAGVLVQEFSIPGVSGLRDLAFDGTYMYGGAAANIIYKMDFNTMTLVATISSPVAVRIIAYDPVADGFWVGTWDTPLTLVSRSGATLNSIANTLLGKYGTAYDGWSDGGPYLWVFDQGGGADTPQLVHQFNIAAGAATGVTYDVGADFASAGDIAGGLFASEGIVPGTASLGGLLQGTPNFLFVYELSDLPPPPSEDPIAYYPFNGNANDESGHGNHGTVFGATLSPDRFGNPSSAHSFDGVDDHIGLPGLLDSPTEVSMALWFNSPTSAADMNLIYHGDNGEMQMGFNGGACTLLVKLSNGLWYGTPPVAATLNNWHLFVGVWERGGELKLYLDGTLRESIVVPDLGLWDASTPNALGAYARSDYFFSGLIDDVQVYNRTLSDQEVLELYDFLPPDPLAQYSVCYGSTGSVEPNNPGALISIDPLTGAGTLIGPTGIIGDAGPSVRALAVKSTGEMYAMSHTASSDLYSVNASTGAGNLVANTGLLRPGDICFDAEDVLHAVDETNILYTIDETTGVRTVVGATGVALAGLAYDPTDGMMYGSGAADDIYTIDLETGAVTLVGTTGLGGNTPDIHFDQAGNLFGVKRGAGGVYDYIAIDKTTGTGTLIGSTGFVAVVGLATRLVPPSAIPCGDVANFQTRCQGGGTIQARLTLANTNYTGEIVEFSIDGSPYQVTVGASGRANLSVGVFGIGLHTVEVTNPAGCVDPVTIRCRSGVAMEGDDLWEDDEVLEVPTTTTLLGNYPNPFNPSTTLRYGLSEPQQVTLRVYNTLGQLVRTIVDEHQVEGYHEAIWDGRNESGTTVASGIYVYRMIAGSLVETRRMLLVK